ncbi:hypothetical protein L3Q82_021175 [Scortum barcoo]|uniref:Uncharacterized protein n=1 Tax=Scortum barcoo TaxID=214431 RepID=A0ACB8X3P0_9TELE|nr:hypothetical protein L3Q82_021175 [Scortum barcoo]
MELRHSGGMGEKHEIPKELLKKYLGCREPGRDDGGANSVFREASVLCFTETWLHDNIPDSLVSLPGFQLVRGDRSCADSRKKKGGGVAVYIGEQQVVQPWTHHGEEACVQPGHRTVISESSPYYLPREFSPTIVITIYIPPPAANASPTNDENS